MALLPSGPFDARQIDPSQGVGQLPISENPEGHLVVIVKSEVKPTKDNTGGYLELTLKITEGPHQGAQGTMRLNLFNNSIEAVKIAQKQLSAICHVTNVLVVEDSNQLHNIPFRVTVGPQKNDPQYTEVKHILDAAGNEPTRAPRPAQSAAHVGNGGGYAPPQQQAPQQEWPTQQQSVAPAVPGWAQTPNKPAGWTTNK